jgi:hypothetical protein
MAGQSSKARTILKKRVSSTPSTSGTDPLDFPGLPFQITLERYHDWIQKGILTSDDRVELLESNLVRQMPNNPPHSAVIRLLMRFIYPMLGSGYDLASQQPITLNSTVSEPEPDLFIFRDIGPAQFDRHPDGDEVLLVVEVSDSSLRLDRGTKLKIYAQAKIPTYWIINLIDRCVEVYTSPIKGKNPRYRQMETYVDGDMLELNLPDHEPLRLAVAELLP